MRRPLHPGLLALVALAMNDLGPPKPEDRSTHDWVRGGGSNPRRCCADCGAWEDEAPAECPEAAREGQS